MSLTTASSPQIKGCLTFPVIHELFLVANGGHKQEGFLPSLHITQQADLHAHTGLC